MGKIKDNKMQLSEIGKIVEREWLKSIQLRPDMNLMLDEYMVMPNHFHAIIIIGNNGYNTKSDTNGRDAMHRVSTNKHDIKKPQNKYAPQSKNLASIIRGFKSAVTVKSRKIIFDFAWQPRFYDRIILDDNEYRRIKIYITENPLIWNEDKHFVD